jgi:hypothetical protein
MAYGRVSTEHRTARLAYLYCRHNIILRLFLVNMRTKLTWITLTMLTLGTEGVSMAESAPAPAAGANDPAHALTQQAGVSAGPELEAALASRGQSTTKSDRGAPVDLNRLGTAADTIASGLSMPSAAGAPMPSNPGGGNTLQRLHGDTTAATSTVAGVATRIVPVGDADHGGPSTSALPLHPEAVIRGQINPAARSCYASDPDSKSRRPGRLVILIKLTPGGEIDSVSVPINIGVSPSVAACITTAARAATFAPPGATAAMIPVSFAFPGQADPAPPADPPVKAAPTADAGRVAHDTVAETETQPTNRETARR